jgi:hypothetical protein
MEYLLPKNTNQNIFVSHRMVYILFDGGSFDMADGKIITHLSFDNDNYLDKGVGSNWTSVGTHVSITSDSYSGSGSLLFKDNTDSYIKHESVPLLNNDFDISFYCKNLKAMCPHTGVSPIYANDNTGVVINPANFTIYLDEYNKFGILDLVDGNHLSDDNFNTRTQNKWVFVKVSRRMDTITVVADNDQILQYNATTNANYAQYKKLSSIGDFINPVYDALEGQIDEMKIILYPRGSDIIKAKPIFIKQY